MNAIAASRVMVLIFSTHSNNSSDVAKELTLAMNSGVVVIPFKIEDISPRGVMQYYLADTHWLDAMKPPTAIQVQELVETVSLLIDDGETAEIAPQVEPGKEIGNLANVTEPDLITTEQESRSPEPNARSRTYGVAGLVAGIVSLFLPVMVLDLLIGVVGVGLSGMGMARQRAGRGVAIAGLIVSIIAVVTALSLLITDPGFYGRLWSGTDNQVRVVLSWDTDADLDFELWCIEDGYVGDAVNFMNISDA